MDEDKKVEAGEQEEKELTAKEKIEVPSTSFEVHTELLNLYISHSVGKTRGGEVKSQVPHGWKTWSAWKASWR